MYKDNIELSYIMGLLFFLNQDIFIGTRVTVSSDNFCR